MFRDVEGAPDGGGEAGDFVPPFCEGGGGGGWAVVVRELGAVILEFEVTAGFEMSAEEVG